MQLSRERNGLHDWSCINRTRENREGTRMPHSYASNTSLVGYLKYRADMVTEIVLLDVNEAMMQLISCNLVLVL